MNNNIINNSNNLQQKNYKIEFNQILYVTLYLITTMLSLFCLRIFSEKMFSLIVIIAYTICSIFILRKINYIRCLLYPISIGIYLHLVFYTIIIVVHRIFGESQSIDWLFMFPALLLQYLGFLMIPLSFIYGLIQDI